MFVGGEVLQLAISCLGGLACCQANPDSVLTVEEAEAGWAGSAWPWAGGIPTEHQRSRHHPIPIPDQPPSIPPWTVSGNSGVAGFPCLLPWPHPPLLGICILKLPIFLDHLHPAPHHDSEVHLWVPGSELSPWHTGGGECTQSTNRRQGEWWWEKNCQGSEVPKSFMSFLRVGHDSFKIKLPLRVLCTKPDLSHI